MKKGKKNNERPEIMRMSDIEVSLSNPGPRAVPNPYRENLYLNDGVADDNDNDDDNNDSFEEEGLYLNDSNAEMDSESETNQNYMNVISNNKKSRRGKNRRADSDDTIPEQAPPPRPPGKQKALKDRRDDAESPPEDRGQYGRTLPTKSAKKSVRKPSQPANASSSANASASQMEAHQASANNTVTLPTKMPDKKKGKKKKESQAPLVEAENGGVSNGGFHSGEDFTEQSKPQLPMPPRAPLPPTPDDISGGPSKRDILRVTAFVVVIINVVIAIVALAIAVHLLSSSAPAPTCHIGMETVPLCAKTTLAPTTRAPTTTANPTTSSPTTTDGNLTSTLADVTTPRIPNSDAEMASTETSEPLSYAFATFTLKLPSALAKPANFFKFLLIDGKLEHDDRKPCYLAEDHKVSTNVSCPWKCPKFNVDLCAKAVDNVTFEITLPCHEKTSLDTYKILSWKICGI